MRRALWLAPLLITFALAACGGDGGSTEGSAVRPVDEILQSGPTLVDLTSTGAAVAITTTIDVVCSIIYGTDTTYGSQATDVDMRGGAHANHRPLLRGLQPDTEYHYRVQGAASDGTIYVSGDFTFRTPPAGSSTLTLGENVATLAAGATLVEASSAFPGEAWEPENAFDSDPASAWSSNGDGDEAFLTIQLAAPTDLIAIGLWSRTMGTSAQIERFQIVTEDGTILGPFELRDADQRQDFAVEVRAERLRFEVLDSSGGNTGIVEIAAFAAP